MFDFLHSILKWQFLNRIQIDRTFYLQLRDRNGSHKSYHTFRARWWTRAEYNKSISWFAQRSCTIKTTALQSYCADKWFVRFVRQASSRNQIDFGFLDFTVYGKNGRFQKSTWHFSDG